MIHVPRSRCVLRRHANILSAFSYAVPISRRSLCFHAVLSCAISSAQETNQNREPVMPSYTRRPPGYTNRTESSLYSPALYIPPIAAPPPVVQAQQSDAGPVPKLGNSFTLCSAAIVIPSAFLVLVPLIRPDTHPATG